jgi:hypothetical protein
MTAALKRCPFCADPMEERQGYARHVKPMGCILGHWQWITIHQWNTRAPDPDAYRAGYVAVLAAALDVASATATDTCDLRGAIRALTPQEGDEA